MGLRNKVLEGLECCARRKDTDVDYCDKCPYFSGCSTEFGAFAELASDALALLKAQEPVEPQERREGDYKNLYCGKCGCGLVGYVGNISKQYYKVANYCDVCGWAVKWND